MSLTSRRTKFWSPKDVFRMNGLIQLKNFSTPPYPRTRLFVPHYLGKLLTLNSTKNVCLSGKKEHMQTFQDLLVYYNKKDVIGFLQA